MRIAILLLCLFLGSCASLFQPGPDPVGLVSDPPQASVSLDGVAVGQTPVQLTVNRSAGGVVKVEKPGYHPVEFKLPTKINGTTFLNAFWGVVLGPAFFLVDGVAGNMSAWYSPNTVQLVPITQEPMTDEEIAEMTGGRKVNRKAASDNVSSQEERLDE